MFDTLKEKIKELAKTAVEKAEGLLGSGEGEAKKQIAIDFILANLPVPDIFKTLIGILLSSVIDDAVEFAVYCMNLLDEET